MPAQLPESVPTEEEIASDFTLNTFKVDLLSVQYKRVAGNTAKLNAQVPFCLGIRGPESLRVWSGDATKEGQGDNEGNVIIPELGEQEIK